MGVGDVGAVHDRRWTSGHPHCCGDDRRARRVNQHGVVHGRYDDQHSPTKQHGRHGLGVGDGAWIRAGHGSLDIEGSSRADGM
jgi:hypothetical protein